MKLQKKIGFLTIKISNISPDFFCTTVAMQVDLKNSGGRALGFLLAGIGFLLASIGFLLAGVFCLQNTKENSGHDLKTAS